MRCLVTFLIFAGGLACGLGGCGGGTLGTGLPDASSFGATAGREQVASFTTISGTLVDEHGAPLADADVEISTDVAHEKARTDSDGYYATGIEFASAVEVALRFSKGSWNTTYTAQFRSSPKTPPDARTFDFRRLANGKVAMVGR